MPKTVYYASVGPLLTLYDIDVDGAELIKHGAVTLPANIQYAWPHPSRRFLYVVSSSGGPGIAGDKHHASALSIDPATGALRPHGDPAALPSRPIHACVDASGRYLLAAYNSPSGVTVHRLEADGTIGAPVAQPGHLDTGIYAHQIRVAPDHRTVILVTRGNNAGEGKPEDPGAIKTFRFNDGVLSNLASVAPGNGLGFGPRHLDFHPTKPWVFVSIERQNKLYVYALDSETGLSRAPLFTKETLSDPQTKVPQGAGPNHVHPSGKFVYLTNRTFPASGPGARKVAPGGENSVAAFAIDEATGEPRLMQNLDGRGLQLRTFGIDPSGRLLVVASIMAAEDGTLPAGITVMRIGADGRLSFVRKYDVDVGSLQQFWSGMVTLG
ncbi:MAG: beta-propeller fold lactonase family protein [Xanthobacteraceae bacterium]